MAQYRYIQINLNNGEIIGDSYLSEQLSMEHLISVDEDFNAVNKKYDLELKEWIEIEPVTPVYVPTQLDRIEAAVNQSKQDIIDEYTLELLESGAL